MFNSATLILCFIILITSSLLPISRKKASSEVSEVSRKVQGVLTIGLNKSTSIVKASCQKSDYGQAMADSINRLYLSHSSFPINLYGSRLAGKANNSVYGITAEGYLIFLSLQNATTKDFCLASWDAAGIDLSVCLAGCQNPIAYIPKCCRKDELFNTTSSQCEENTHANPWTPTLHEQNKDKSYPRLRKNETSLFQAHFAHRLKDCIPSPDLVHTTTSQHFLQDLDGRIEIRLLTSGELVYKRHSEDSDEAWDLWPLDFCLDGESKGKENVLLDLDSCSEVVLDPLDIDIFAKCNFTTKLKPEGVLDAAEKRAQIERWINVAHSILMVLSSIFLLSAMLIYFALWEKQNTHGWTVLTYIASLFFAYIFLAIYKFIGINHEAGEEAYGFGCKLNGILAHFFFLSVFSWLTIINFDIWWKFWDLKSTPTKAKDVLRYMKYALFAFGIPFLIVLTGILIESSGSTGMTPSYGKNWRCFLQTKALGVYLFYPIAALMALNFMFFLSTTFKIYAHFKHTTNIHEAKTQQQVESCKVIMKLFVVMGVTWVSELLSYLLENSSSSLWTVYFWSVLDCANILQALGIFYIFIWKRLILTQLTQKYPSLRPFLRHLKGLPGCKKRVDYQYSARMTTKSTRRSGGPDSQKKNQRSRKLSDSGQQTSFETVELAL